MSCFNNCYLPQPPRAWSRVQNSCSLITDTDNNSLVTDPYTKQLITRNALAEKIAMMNKGNILQYKANSSNLTKAQKYSKIAKGQWTNRNTTWATQSTRGYTNPNTTSLKRSGNVVNIALDPITGAILGPTFEPPTCPNPIAPEYEDLPANGGGGSDVKEPDIPPPVEPSSGSNVFPDIIPITPADPIIIQDGGSLICSIQENICTGETKSSLGQQLCHPTTDSDVPGPIQELCWNDGQQTWYPRQRYVMSNSTDKWPVNYKPFVSAIRPYPPVITSINHNNCFIILNWIQNETCLPVSLFNIYQDNTLIKIVSGNVFTCNIDIDPTTITEYTYFITAEINTNIISDKSNIVNITVYPVFPPVINTVTEAPNEITIYWNEPDNSNQILVFYIYRSISNSSFSLLATIPKSTFPMSYVDNGLNNNTLYSYYVVSGSNCNLSKQSNISSSTPLNLYEVTGNPYFYTSGNYYYLTFTNNGTFKINYSINNFTVVAVGGGGGGGGSYADGAPNSAAGAGGGGGGVGVLSSYVPVVNYVYDIIVGLSGNRGNGKNSGGSGGSTSFLYNSINYLTSLGGGGGQSFNNGVQGGTGGYATSELSITSYDGGNGGNCYPPSAQPGLNWSGLPIVFPDSSSYSFSGGGGGGYQFVSPIYKTGAFAGFNGSGGGAGPNNIGIQGQDSNSFGSGGGGAGYPDYQDSFDGGIGGAGVLKIYFSYP